VIRLAIRVRAAQAELALAELLELAPAGVEEVELGDGVVEYAVYGSPGELPRLPDLRAAVGGGLVEVSSSEIADDWSERWRRFHVPVQVSSPAPGLVPSLWVHPPWEAPRGDGATLEIAIDPGQAFGTGGHATTRLCLELLLELAASELGRGALVDMGTGSGVLAIAAAKLGFAPVLALDNDRQSVAAAADNASVNGVDVGVRLHDVRTDTLAPTGVEVGDVRETVVVANLLRPLLLELARTLRVTPAHLLAGGLLVDEVDEVARAFSGQLGLVEHKRCERGEWAAVWLRAVP
jgi:ribosomal protein L11 methyltransferase